MKPIGHALTLTLLQEALNQGHVSNAYLFVGKRGIGKRTLARWFAEQLLHVPKQRQLPLDGHPDFYTLEPLDAETGKRGTTKIDAVQSLISYLRQQPLVSRRSVILLDQADTLTFSAANALLKTLEEPRKAVLLLTTDRPDAIVTTIRSRCQTYHLQPLSMSECRAVLAPFVQTVPDVFMVLSPGQPGQILQHCRLVNSLPPEVTAALQAGIHAPHECLQLAKTLTTLTKHQQLWLLQWWQRSYFDQPQLWEYFDEAIAQLEQHVQPNLLWDVLLLSLDKHRSLEGLTLSLPAPVALKEAAPPRLEATDPVEPTKSRQSRRPDGKTKLRAEKAATKPEAITKPETTGASAEGKPTLTQHPLF